MVRPLVILCVVAAFGGADVRAADLPGGMGLYARSGQALPMLDSTIEVTVRGPIIEAVVTQRFHNRADHATEATYIFPLPVDAAVSAMSIKSGKRTIRAAIERRAEAQRRYEIAVRAGVTAAVLDQERPDVFTQTVAGIPPKSTVEVTLRFDMMARYANGTWELVLPMVVAPRYVPGAATARPTTGMGRAPDTDRAPDASRVTPGGAPGAGGSTEVAIRFVDKVTDVTSSTHELVVTGERASFVDPRSDHDAVVRWKAARPAAGWVERSPDGGYAAVIVEAGVPAPRKGALRCMLVLDRSASARGDAEAMARPLVHELLDALGPADRVAVSGSDQIAWSPPASVARALAASWHRRAGAFDLTRVLATSRPAGAPIILVTSGLVADDRAAIAAARKLGVPVHVIGVGPAPARGLLTQIAVATGGTARFAVPGDDLPSLAKAALADVASQPAPLAVSWGTLAAREVVPGVLPRLGAGQAMLVLARVKQAQTANARVRGELFAIEALPASRAVEGATTSMGPLARRWARSRLDELLAGRPDPARVTQLALRYGLVSPYTSMVAVGSEVVVQGGTRRSVSVPVSVPAGMKWQQVKKEITVDTTSSTPTVGAATATKRLDDGKPVAGKARPAPARVPIARDAAPAEDTGGGLAPAGGTADDLADSQREEHEPASEAEDEDAMNMPAPRVALTGTSSDGSSLEEISKSESVLGRGLRLATSLGAGFAAKDAETRGLLAVGARLELARGRTLLGIDGSLWLVQGSDVQGRVLLSFARLGIARWLEIGGGLGLHAGDGVGPAGSLSLRLHLPPAPRAATYLRYDGAVLRDADDVNRGQQTLTLGVEWGF